jgi:peptidyl-prolyl cis-trans isomerase C
MSVRTLRAGALTRTLTAAALLGLLLAPGTALAKKKAPVAPPPGTPERTGAVLVTVNGQPITQGMIDTALTVLPEDVRQQVLEGGLLAQLQEKLVLQELLWQEAIARGMPDDPAIRAKMVLAQRDVLASAVIETEIAKRSDDAAVKAYYDGHPEMFNARQVHARHILVADEAKAKAILARAQAGEDFAALARENSQDPGSGPNGGDLGWFGKGQMVPEFETAAFAARTGALEGPVKSQYGYHLIQVLEARENVPFEDVRDAIRGQLQDEAGRQFLQELRERASVVTPGAAAPALPAPQGENAKK